MNKDAPIIFVVMILFVPVCVFAQAGTRRDIPLHHFQLSCGTCHTSGSSSRISGSRDNPNNVGEVKGDINRLCTSSGCHNYEPSLNHPVGIRANVTIPKDMPLDSYSRITCLTCHAQPKSELPSEASFASDYSDDGQELFLRRPEGIQFCGSCHMRMGGTLQKQSHWQFSTRAHLGSINPQSSNSGIYNQSIGGLDTESRICMGCHDDVSVTIPSDNETPRQRKLRWARMSDHPIGMNYDNIALRRPRDYRYPLFDQQIRLFNGRVGCGSCHSLYSQIKKNLTIRNRNSVLCLKCHNK